MRKVFVLGVIAILDAALLVPAVASAKDPSVKPDKVTVCHVTGTAKYHSITISKNAEPAHLAHGDAPLRRNSRHREVTQRERRC